LFNVMSSMYYLPMFAAYDPVSLPLRDRSLVVASVVLAHVLLLWSYVLEPGLPKPAHHEMSISMALPSQPQAAPVKPEPKPETVVKPMPVEPRRVQPVPETAAPEAPVEMSAPAVAGAVSAQPVNVLPGPPDREPDYQAAYLNNPKPDYPMVAQRMGWQGRVVLNVEVLASGLPGQIKLHQSSGQDVLDNAAMQAVRSWRFIAARQGGRVIAKWFLVPIPFVLKED
jgi:protein TonB